MHNGWDFFTFRKMCHFWSKCLFFFAQLGHRRSRLWHQVWGDWIRCSISVWKGGAEESVHSLHRHHDLWKPALPLHYGYITYDLKQLYVSCIFCKNVCISWPFVQAEVTAIQESHMRMMWYCLGGRRAGGSAWCWTLFLTPLTGWDDVQHALDL